MRILIVDDQPEILKVLGQMLDQTGHQVVLEQDSKKAVGEIEDGLFDVLVTDMMMPEVAGIDLIREVRRTNAELWIVAMSGGGDALPVDTVLKISEAYGADRILYKPFLKSEFIDAIEKK